MSTAQKADESRSAPAGVQRQRSRPRYAVGVTQWVGLMVVIAVVFAAVIVWFAVLR